MPKPDVSDQRIPQILAAAAKIFSRDGIDGASMAQIAKSADLSKATIYHYFDSKDALVEALVRNLFDADQSEMEAWVQSPAPAAERLQGYAANLVTLLESHQVLYPIFAEFKARAVRNPSIQGVLEGYFNGYIDAFARIIRQGIEQAELRVELHPQEAALALAALIEGCILMAQNLNKPLALVMQPSVGIFVDGLRA